MKRSVLPTLALCFAVAQAASATADAAEFSFGVIAQASTSSLDDAVLQAAIEETDSDNLAFVAIQGIKSSDAPCTDKVYLRQKALLDSARNGLIVSLSASDWAKCPGESGKSSSVAKLAQLRDLFFFDDFSLGATRIPVIRQSTIAKFRGFPENTRWQIGPVMFATINLPANNNNYIVDAGRNSEFEDRLVANRDWLNRIFTFAQREKMAGIVLFSESNPFLTPRIASGQRDGYAETRKLIISLAGKFTGRILVVHRQTSGTPMPVAIHWQGNVGELSASTAWAKVNVDTTHARLFATETQAAQVVEGSR